MIEFGSSSTIAVLDASALFSIRVTDLALQAAAEGLFQPRWSAKIHDEWTAALLRRNPAADKAKIAYRRDTMDRSFPDALVPASKAFGAAARLPDPNDAHVIATAIAAEANSIVTFNLRHFPAAVLEPLDMQAVHPDTFLCNLLEISPSRFLKAARAVRRRRIKPPQTIDDFLGGLERAKLPGLAAALKMYSDAI